MLGWRTEYDKFNLFEIDFPKFKEWNLYSVMVEPYMATSVVVLSQPVHKEVRHISYALNLEYGYKYLVGDLKPEDGSWDCLYNQDGHKLYRQ